MRYWFSSSPEGCIAYLDTGRAWVTAGAPIGAVEHLGDLGQQFVEAARRAGRRTVFFGVERRFTGSAPFAAVQIGEQPVWDPSGWPGPSGGSRSMREQLRRARAKGVSVRAAGPEELGPGSPLRQKIESLVQGWLTSRRMPRMG